MSLFGSAFMGDCGEEDPFFGAHMRSMRQMNNMMSSLFADPFAMMPMPGLQQIAARGSHDSLMPFGGFPGMGMGMGGMGLNINRLLGGSLDSLSTEMVNGNNCQSYSSSSVVRMSSGPDGKPQVYRASTSTRTGPGGVRETQRSVQDSRTGTKKLAIGHHIGERAHVIEREEDLHTGDQEERQEFINLDEEEADDFNREWETKVRPAPRHTMPAIMGSSGQHRAQPRQLALPSSTGPTSSHSYRRSRNSRSIVSPLASPRRAIRSSIPSTSSTSAAVAARSPYSPPQTQTSQTANRKRNIKSVSGTPDL